MFITEKDGIGILLDVRSGVDGSTAIENQEKRAQSAVVNSSKLPCKMNDMGLPYEILWKDVPDYKEMEYWDRVKLRDENNKKYTKSIYEKMGIKVLEEIDEMFVKVDLPIGWKVAPTSHSMWNDILDDKGQKRAQFFYKWGDEAFTNLNRRFYMTTIPFDEYKCEYINYEDRNVQDWYGVVRDGENIIFKTKGLKKQPKEVTSERVEDILLEECKAFLEEHFPMYDDSFMYWDITHEFPTLSSTYDDNKELCDKINDTNKKIVLQRQKEQEEMKKERERQQRCVHRDGMYCFYECYEYNE